MTFFDDSRTITGFKEVEKVTSGKILNNFRRQIVVVDNASDRLSFWELDDNDLIIKAAISDLNIANPRGAAFADFDGDALEETMAVLSRNAQRVEFFTFNQATSKFIPAPISDIRNIEANDSCLDLNFISLRSDLTNILAFANYSDQNKFQIKFYKKSGSQFTLMPSIITVPNADFIEGLAFADTNQDGYEDLMAVAVDYTPDTSDRFLFYRYNGTIWSPVHTIKGTDLSVPFDFIDVDIALADFDYDGKIEMVYAQDNGSINFLKRLTDTIWVEMATPAIAKDDLVYCETVAFADLTCTGRIDLLSAFGTSNKTAIVYLGQTRSNYPSLGSKWQITKAGKYPIDTTCCYAQARAQTVLIVIYGKVELNSGTKYTGDSVNTYIHRSDGWSDLSWPLPSSINAPRAAKCCFFENETLLLVANAPTVDGYAGSPYKSDGFVQAFRSIPTGWQDLGPTWKIPNLTGPEALACGALSVNNTPQNILFVASWSDINDNPKKAMVRSYVHQPTGWSDLGANWAIVKDVPGFSFGALDITYCYFPINGIEQLVLFFISNTAMRAYIRNNNAWSDLGASWALANVTSISCCYPYLLRFYDGQVSTLMRSDNKWKDLGEAWQISNLQDSPGAICCLIDGVEQIIIPEAVTSCRVLVLNESSCTVNTTIQSYRLNDPESCEFAPPPCLVKPTPRPTLPTNPCLCP